MKFIIGLLVGIWVGGPFGFLLAGIFIASAQADENIERLQKESESEKESEAEEC